MQKINNINFNGYIEGYYGRLLNWSERKLILDKLNKNNMSYYFYAPKEDDKHRLNWNKNYPNLWKESFKQFCTYAKTKEIRIIAGISPGLSFDFRTFKKMLIKNQISNDFQILIEKAKYLLSIGADDIALLFDDLPENFYCKFGNEFREGSIHAELSNQLFLKLNKRVFVVPRVYADELITDDISYLYDYGKNIIEHNITFYSGENIVSQKINKKSLLKISKLIPNTVVFWDNFYANDYCPRRIFLGPYTGRSEIDNIMINPTGLIKTDLLILDIIYITKNSSAPLNDWRKLLINNKIPSEFFEIKEFFLKPDFGNNPPLKKIQFKKNIFDYLDYLLWEWKSGLSREWFPFLLGLKHDLQIYRNNLPSERIIKLQTKPLAGFIL